MQEISISELKEKELEILRYVDNLCKKNNLRYFACGGTLIGAIRHNGYIPWDDDIDIDMPRPDYEILCKIVNEDSSPYRFLSMNDEGYYYVFGKVVDTRTELIEQNIRNKIAGLGVGIDIFPLDGLPLDKKKAIKRFAKYRRLRLYLFGFSDYSFPKISKRNIALSVKTFLAWGISSFYRKTIGMDGIKRRLEKLYLEYDYDDSNYICNIGGRYSEKDFYPAEWFSKLCRHGFENTDVSIPCGYDDYLRKIYGNYMELPPIEQQVPEHNFETYWKDNI